MELADDHKQRKRDSYWSNLVEGSTGSYKAVRITELLQRHFPATAEAVLDIGAGTSFIALDHAKRLGAQRIVFADYDEKVIEESKRVVDSHVITWCVADIFEIDQWTERFDLVFLLDMVHEVYSFYGRPNRDTDEQIDHDLGISKVRESLQKVASLVEGGGGIVISDNILTDANVPVKVRVKTPAARNALETFFRDYRTRRMEPRWIEETVFELLSRDLCVLLTQYNKIKQRKWDRWNVERLEVHQYMSESEYRAMFDELGFDIHIVVGTPADARDEWNEDFEVLSGLPGLPEKRVTLLAVRR